MAECDEEVEGGGRGFRHVKIKLCSSWMEKWSIGRRVYGIWPISSARALQQLRHLETEEPASVLFGRAEGGNASLKLTLTQKNDPRPSVCGVGRLAKLDGRASTNAWCSNPGSVGKHYCLRDEKT